MISFNFNWNIFNDGGESEDPNVFSEEIFNFSKAYSCSTLIVGGFVLEIFAIMLKSDNKN